MNKTVYVSLQQARILEGRARDKGADTLAHGLSACLPGIGIGSYTHGLPTRHGHLIPCFQSPKGSAAALLLFAGMKWWAMGLRGSRRGQHGREMSQPSVHDALARTGHCMDSIHSFSNQPTALPTCLALIHRWCWFHFASDLHAGE